MEHPKLWNGALRPTWFRARMQSIGRLRRPITPEGKDAAGTLSDGRQTVTASPSRDVASYFLSKVDEDDGPITHLKLQKLLYYAQGFHLAVHNEPLFAEEIEAWAHGPVVPTVWQIYRGKGSDPIPPTDGFDPESIPEVTRQLLDEVYEVYGQFTAWRLREMTHAEAPWKNHAERGDVISHEELRQFFLTRLKT